MSVVVALDRSGLDCRSGVEAMVICLNLEDRVLDCM